MRRSRMMKCCGGKRIVGVLYVGVVVIVVVVVVVVRQVRSGVVSSSPLLPSFVS